jgi:nucleoside-diphosphate-sugar epimerase
MKVLVTGGAGYIGSTLCRILLDNGYEVRTVDYMAFGGEALTHLATNPKFEIIKDDIRNFENLPKYLEGVDAVIHLAAIVGDPACAKFSDDAESINWGASVKLYELAQATPSVKRFVFASTCSNYGKMKGDGYVVEDSELSPVSLYAQLKVKFENHLLTSNTRKDFIPTALRFATVYGFSTRMRFDLTVNEFTRDMFLGEKLVIFGEQFWRPYCHVEDLARSAMLVLQSEAEKVDHNVFNVGNTEENYTKRMLGDLISKHLPEAEIEYVQKTEDPRDYRVNFDKITNQLGYSITKRVEDGVTEILKVLRSEILPDPKSKRFSNI